MGNRVVSAKRLPVCGVSSGAVGVTTNFPIGLSYAELLYWYWVSNWNNVTISSNASASSSVTDDNSQTANSSISFSSEIVGGYYKSGNQITITNEKELVCDGIYGVFTKSLNDNHCTNPIDEKYACVAVHINASISIDFNQINFSDGLYYPYVNAQISGGDELSIFHPELEQGSNFGFGWSTENPVENPLPGFTDWSSIELNAFGKTARIYGGISDYGSHSGYSYTLPSFLSLEPTSYWPYATKIGNVVYNTETGEQLNNPFS